MQSYIPYVVVGDRAVPALYESKHEWDIMFLLARKIQERALARGDRELHRRQGCASTGIDHLYDEMCADGHYGEGPEGERKALDYIMRYSQITRPRIWASSRGRRPPKTAW